MMLEVLFWGEALCAPPLYLHTWISSHRDGFLSALGILHEFLFLSSGQLGWVVLCWTRNPKISCKHLPLEGGVSTRLEEPVSSLLPSLGALPGAVETSKQKASPTSCHFLWSHRCVLWSYGKILHSALGKKEQVNFLSSPVEWFHTSFMQLFFSWHKSKSPPF